MSHSSFLRPLRAAVCLGLLFLLLGCATVPTVSTRKLIQHQAMLDFAGLKPSAWVAEVKATCQAPENWLAKPLHKTAMFTHQHWLAPSSMTGVGVAHVKMPLPLPARTVVWFARNQYLQKRKDGKLIDQWSDGLGRPWFEAENNQYHVRGYVVTSGFDAWVVYCGYKVTRPPNPDEINLAARAMESIVPNVRRAIPSKATAQVD